MAMAAMATEQLARAVGSLQPLAAAAAAALSKPPDDDDDEGSKGTASRAHGDDGDRSVAADIRRREISEAPERHVAALVLFARAARTLAAIESARATSGGTGVGAHHLGDAVEWLYASYGADVRGVVAEAQARALLKELRECVGCVAESRR